MIMTRHISTNGQYPPELVNRVQELYQDHGLIITAKLVGISRPALRRLMTAHQIEVRGRGEVISHGSWTGDHASPTTALARVCKVRGLPSHCESCGKTGPGRYSWICEAGEHLNLNAYKRMCQACTHPQIGTVGGHYRVYRSRGKAAAQVCEHCGGQARDWANIHGQPRGDPKSYMPLCRSCHTKYDRKQVPSD